MSCSSKNRLKGFYYLGYLQSFERRKGDHKWMISQINNHLQVNFTSWLLLNSFPSLLRNAMATCLCH